MRNPNGYGSVVKLSGQRRKPYIVRITEGFENGKQKFKTLESFTTREEAMIFLAEYNKSPYDVDASKVTLEELFEKWKTLKGEKLGSSNYKNLCAAYKHVEPLHKAKYKELKTYHMQQIVDEKESPSIQEVIKRLFHHLDNFAMELDVTHKKYSEMVKVKQRKSEEKIPFTHEEIQELWNNAEKPWVDSILVLLYTGFRIGELLDLRKENIDFEKMVMIGGSKTEAGKDRTIPIHPKILPLIQARMEGNTSKYLFSLKGSKVNPSRYYEFYYGLLNGMGIERRTPHATRHTIRTELEKVGANKKAIDMIIGHKSADIGLRVYVHFGIEELHEAINLIRY